MLQTDLLVKALLAYSVHEHQLGHTRHVDVWPGPEQIALRDDGRGIGLDRHGYVENLLGTLVGRSSEVQLHGIGLSLVAAVTPSLVVQSTRGGVGWRQSFEFGVAIEPPTRLGPGQNAGTLITLAGLPPLSQAGVSRLAAQSKVWRAASPGLEIVFHENHRPTVAGREPIPSAAAAEFAEIAKGFCDWCEAPTSFAPADVAATAWLARLHAAALALPEVEPESEDGMLPLPEPEASRAKANLSVFDGFYYREYFKPDPRLSDESCIGDVGDDLADIYSDVRGGLLFYERGQPVEALWHWSFLHQSHWGRHAVGAMFALQCARSFRDEPYDGV